MGISKHQYNGREIRLRIRAPKGTPSVTVDSPIGHALMTHIVLWYYYYSKEKTWGK